MPSSVASLIVIPTIFLSIMPPPPMSPTFLHLSLNGNSLAKLGIIRPALGESSGLITQLSPPSPLEVKSTIIVTTLQSSKISLNMFKRRSLKSLTLIGTSSSSTRPSLLLSFTATKQSGGSLPTIYHLDRLFQERPLTPFLQPIRNNQRGLPAAPDNVTRRITTALEFALQVAQGKSPPLSDSNLKKECGQRIPYIVYSKRKPVAPDLDKDFPPMSVSSAASAKAPPHIPAAKSRLPAATIVTQSFPPPPPYTSEDVTAPTGATPTVLPETAAPSHISSASSAPPPPPISAQDDMVIDPPDTGTDAPMSSEATRPATDMEVEAVDPAEPLPLGGFKIQALRPTVHPPQPRPTGNRIEKPSFTRPALFQLFAEAFRPLPTLFSRFGDLTTKWGKRYSGWEIFTWLFPSMASKAPDPLPNPADPTPATPDTPFQALVDRFVDLDSTFADARKMSQPQIVPETVDHLTFLPAPSPSPFKLPALLEYLSARIDPTLAELRAHDLSPTPFLTLIVGSPAHPLAGKALHSHLVGCFTNNETHVTLPFSSLSAMINAYPSHWNGRLSSRLWPLFVCTPPSYSWSARRIIPSVPSRPWMISSLVFLDPPPSTPSPLTQAWFARMSFFAFLLQLTLLVNRLKVVRILFPTRLPQL